MERMGTSRRRTQPGGWRSYEPPRKDPRPWERPDWSGRGGELFRDADGRCVVRLSPDYAAELPLWGQHWEALNLDASLMTALADWQQQFDDYFHPNKGWLDRRIQDEWATAADDLVRRMRRALPASVELEVDLWPISPEVLRKQSSPKK